MNETESGSPTAGTVEHLTPSDSCEDTVPPLRENELEITVETLTLVQQEANKFAEEYARKARFSKLRKVRRRATNDARILMAFAAYLEDLKTQFLESVEDVDN